MTRTAIVLLALPLALALTQVAGVAQKAAVEKVTLDFEGFESGVIVTGVPHPGTEHMIRIRGINPRFSQNAAVIFDSAQPVANDIDLGTPHKDFEVEREGLPPVPGPGEGDGGRKERLCRNDEPLGKLLIVDDDLAPTTSDGRVAAPDDEGHAGGHLVIDFAEVGPVTIHDMAVIDIEEPDAVVWFYSVDMQERQHRPRKNQVLARYRVHTEDNGVARLFDPEHRADSEKDCHVTLLQRRHGEPLEPIEGVLCIETVLNGSGAIAQIVYSLDEVG